ncbi:NO-inducible flavohemoprotein [Peribacillus butanolivorans]|uniref:Flavohemoprotein n=1 Tax=Peribacillus butanolivorans TaxID=421767 RepID=A0AAX0RYZ9_9BACI|nr:NO-inducible flavohemoprotein [Peribacillus butanolivorans]AXN37275.1 NO-inducible flavohemoprotein [Peribacillus butanolivorans]PEJ31237.1 NO-inducible flavohemoprotein [Peribacillus butanolivorans]QNU04254.1 NO-inducible flavohemoprotein [Peribacillus butanolivorans]
MLSQKTIDIIKSTVPVLEVHGTTITTVFYENLFEAHPELLNVFNHANQKKGRQQNALANTVLAAAKYIDQLETILPAVKQIAQKHRSLAVKPEHYPIVGEFLLGAIKEVLKDAATEEIIHAWGEAYGVIAGVFISIEKEMYDQASNQDGGWSDFKPFTVVEKVQESDVITSFYLKPANGDAVPSFLPGQYVTIRMEIQGERYLFNRQYSLSASPGKDYFRISVKKEKPGISPDGRVSNYLHEVIQVGDMIDVTAPAGDFTINMEKQTPLVFLSGGVGITPFMSMVHAVADQKPERDVQFIHASENGALQPFRSELTELSRKLTNYQLSFVYKNPSEEDKNLPNFEKQGYMDAELLSSHVKPEADYYVCGPVPFMKAIITCLKELGIDPEKIHYEFFGPAIAL